MLISVNKVTKRFKKEDSWLFADYQQVLTGVSLTIRQGECVGIIGESGSGKSTLGKIILGLEKPDSGEVCFSDEMASLAKHQAMSVVFQDYNTSVNPRLSIREIINEPLIKQSMTPSQREAMLVSLLEEVGLTGEFLDRYPHQLSGGQLQRVCIARAIAPSPKFILLDEAVSSLDVSVQVQVLNLLLRLKQQRNIAYLFITHDRTVATFLCDRLAFFQHGNIVEQVDNMQQLPFIQHPYAQALLQAAFALEVHRQG